MKRQNKTMVAVLSLSREQAQQLTQIAKELRLSVSEVVSFCISKDLADFAAQLEAVKEMDG